MSPAEARTGQGFWFYAKSPTRKLNANFGMGRVGERLALDATSDNRAESGPSLVSAVT